jgi:hypothetical protein
VKSSRSSTIASPIVQENCRKNRVITIPRGQEGRGRGEEREGEKMEYCDEGEKRGVSFAFCR